MDNYLQGIPFNLFLIFFLVGLFLLLAFGLYRKFVMPVQMLKDNGLARHNALVRVEIIVWALYAAMILYLALKTSLLLSSIFLLLVIITFLDFWRNFFIGLILKFSAHFHPGDAITINDISGRIARIGYRSLRMITRQGEEVLIPFRLVNSVIRVEQHNTPKVMSKTLEIDVSAMESIHLKDRIEKAIYRNPWIIVNKPINITITDNSAQINFYVLDSELFDKAKRAILDSLK